MLIRRPRLVWLPGDWEHVGCWLVVCLLIMSIRGAGYFAVQLEFVDAISRFRIDGFSLWLETGLLGL